MNCAYFLVYVLEIIKHDYMIIPSNTTHGKLIIELFHYSECNVFLHSEENTTEQERQQQIGQRREERNGNPSLHIIINWGAFTKHRCPPLYPEILIHLVWIGARHESQA